MEYKVGDKVELKIGNEILEVKITFVYDVYMSIGIANTKIYDGIILKNKHSVTFDKRDILKKVEVKCEKCKFFNEENGCTNFELCINNNLFVEKEVVEEKKYLKTWEAIKALEEGHKVRKTWWNKDWFIKLEKGVIYNQRDEGFNFNFISEEEKWEIYEEPKKEIPKEFEGLKYILGSINNMDCGEKDCDKCPLGIDKCDMLDEIFFDMKEKYIF